MYEYIPFVFVSIHAFRSRTWTGLAILVLDHHGRFTLAEARSPAQLEADFELLGRRHHLIPTHHALPVGGHSAENRGEVALHCGFGIVERLAVAQAPDEGFHVVDGPLAEGVVFFGPQPGVVAGDAHQPSVVGVHRPLETEAARAQVREAARQLVGAEVGVHAVGIPEGDQEMVPGIVVRRLGVARPFRAATRSEGPQGVAL